MAEVICIDSSDDEPCQARKMNLSLSPGPLGIGIQQSSDGLCIVTSIPREGSSVLQVGDIIQSLNGIVMATVEGGISAWTRLFTAFSTGTRNVVVQRGQGIAAAKSGNSVKSQKKDAAPGKGKIPPTQPATKTAEPAKKGKKKGLKHTESNANHKRKQLNFKSKPTKDAKKAKNTTTSAKAGTIIPDWNHDDAYMKMISAGFPAYGRIDPSRSYYICANGDSTHQICETVGLDDWRQLGKVEFNARFYGKMKASLQFQRGTIIKLPTKLCSKWKLSKLMDNHVEEVQEAGTCSKCGKKENPDDEDQMLICDGCDLEIHVSCAGLDSVPEGDFLCEKCLDVMSARKAAAADGRERSLKIQLPELPALDNDSKAMAVHASTRFEVDITARRDEVLSSLAQNTIVMAETLEARIVEAQSNVERQTNFVSSKQRSLDSARNSVFLKYGLEGWQLKNFGLSYIKYRKCDGSTGVVRKQIKYYDEDVVDPEWEQYYRKVIQCSREMKALNEARCLSDAKKRLSSLTDDLNELRNEQHSQTEQDQVDRRRIEVNFAKLLSSPQLDWEKKKEYENRRGCAPLFLGAVIVQNADEVRLLNVLTEPVELVVTIPVHPSAKSDSRELQIGSECYVFGAAELFCSDRNDQVPMDFAPTSVRGAQRDLMAMLLRDQRNGSLRVTRTSIPSSVSLRGTSDERLGDTLKCFDLSELVRDCQYPISGMPSADTPAQLAKNGLVLRNYQKTSLQWLLDKEKNPSGLGSAGELWSRMRGIGSDQSFYFCELTGSIISDIFDYSTDVGQKDASKLCGDSFPSSAIIGSEMGLGKTVIALSLIVASPPSIQNRVLPREHIATIDHPAYVAPPTVVHAISSSSKKAFLSNGTLVVAPMTLCPQWQSEIERFAPFLSCLTLHNEEKNKVEDIASKDIVVISTFLLSSSMHGNAALMSKLKRIHFHRIMVDESHYNNTGDRVKTALAQLSSTHRYCVTGTPVGHSLVDLYGQLRFLRVPQFARKDFWKQNINKPYAEHNYNALNVLRSLLSRTAIRHSKAQTVGEGDALIALPPRTVETLLIEFGSEAERKMYDYLETKNTTRFKSLRTESPSTVLGKFMELQGMLYSARLACAHASIVNLDSIHKVNEKLRAEKEKKERDARGKNGTTEPEKKKTNLTRLEVFQEAILKARPSAQGRMREAVLQLQEGEIEYIECPICLEPTTEKDLALTPCAHKFCAECLLSCVQTSSDSREASGNCPECRDRFRRSELTFLGDANDAGTCTKADKPEAKAKPSQAVTNVIVNGFKMSSIDKLTTVTGASDKRVSFNPLSDEDRLRQRAVCYSIPPEFLTSWNDASVSVGTKVARLLEEVKSMIRADASNKAVVFSQFLGTLDVASEELVGCGIKFARVDGHMKQYQRADNISNFTTDPETKVLLLSMRAGAAGLNLMAANYAFLMDPATNAAIEEQAIDRIHRIGQTRPVTVKRLILKDTVEQRIIESRRSIGADGPSASTQIDGTNAMDIEAQQLSEEDKRVPRNFRRAGNRAADEINLDEQKFNRLRQLESLFGSSATLLVHKA